MINFHWSVELANERIRDGLHGHQDRELVLLASQDRPARRSFVRRPTALLLAALSRRTAAIVMRLDECVAEDLGRALSPTEGMDPWTP